MLVDGVGRERVIGPIGNAFAPRLSPDGRTVAVTVVTGEAMDVHVIDVTTGNASRRTFSAAARNPLWSPDGRSLTYWGFQSNSSSAGVYEVPADGSGPPRRLAPESNLIPIEWAADGRLLVNRINVGGRLDLALLSFAGDSAIQTTHLSRDWDLAAPDVSPDGRWVAYASWERGTPEVEVGSFPTAGARYQISSGGGVAARWSADGRTLFYLRPDGTLMAATVQLGDAVTVVEQAEVPGVPTVTRSSYDPHPDGKRFLLLRDLPVSRPELIVALNWFTTLRERLRTAN